MQQPRIAFSKETLQKWYHLFDLQLLMYFLLDDSVTVSFATGFYAKTTPVYQTQQIDILSEVFLFIDLDI